MIRLACSVEDCGGKVLARGLCKTHYHRARRAGGLPPVRNADGSAIKYIETVALSYSGRGCLNWPFPLTKKGYGRLYVNGKRTAPHRYICELSNGAPPSATYEAAHNCGNAACVNPRHLRWATPKENAADRSIHGTERRGERHHCAKLTEEQVREIRALSKYQSQLNLSKMFKISHSSVNEIYLGKTWSHIPMQDRGE